MTLEPQGQMSLSITSSVDPSVDYVQIRGDVDLADGPALGRAATQLRATDAATIYVDLGGVTFMGSTLVAFLVRIGSVSDWRRPLVLCRPTTMACKVIHMTGLNQVARVRPDLPTGWPQVIG
jgi:anti-anti-sigma factor